MKNMTIKDLIVKTFEKRNSQLSEQNITTYLYKAREMLKELVVSKRKELSKELLKPNTDKYEYMKALNHSLFKLYVENKEMSDLYQLIDSSRMVSKRNTVFNLILDHEDIENFLKEFNPPV